MKQLISIEEQNSKIDELFKERLGIDLVDNADKHVIRLFAKWYAERVIDKCADEIKVKVTEISEGGNIDYIEMYYCDGAIGVTVSKESILNVKNML